jgi:hypothetical protein
MPKLRHSHDAGNISPKPQKPVLTSLLRLFKRHASMYAIICAAGAFLLISTLPTFAQARCDTDKSCIGAALTLSQSAQAQYVDIRKTASQNTLTSALTFEAWLNPTRQAGVRQFVAGLWGPNTDQNDAWVVYISEQDELVFEINGATTSLGAMDNTVARTNIASRYNTWFHVAAIFDGATQTARLLIGGVEVAQNRNAAQPASVLRTPQSASLLMQIGNTNALNNIGERNATYRGQLDEIRLWSRALSQSEVFCGLTSSLEGNTALANERGLVLYYRCNEATNAVTLCDATNNGNTGDLRSGARCLAPTQNRTIPQVLAATPAQFTESFLCDQTRTYSVQIRNASPSCSEQVSISLSGQDASQFTISPQRFTLAAGGSTQATVRLQTSLTGELQAIVNVARANRCGDTLQIPLRLIRSTLVQPSVRVVTFATLFAGCREIPFLESTFTLRNTGGAPITLQSLTSTRAQMFRVLTTFPQQLGANSSVPVVVGFAATDSAGIYNDTLRIRTSDFCQPELAIPVRGTIEEAVVIRRGYGLARLDSVTFGRECPEGGISDPVDFTWESVSSSATVRIDTVIYPAFMRGKSLRYPVLLRPNTFADPNFLRFAPVSAGFVRDSVIIRASIPNGNIAGCTFEKKIYVSGRGNAILTRLNTTSVNAGTVVVGQQSALTPVPTLTNPSAEDTLRVSVYFRTGGVFTLTGARAFTLLPRQTVPIPITFRPDRAGTFTDELCVFEQRCFFTTCASVVGRGVEQVFRFDSAVKRIENVLGCATRQDSVVIRNLTNTDQLLTNITFTDQSGGRITELSGLTTGVIMMPRINANSSITLLFRYTPNDLTQDRTDAAFFRFTAAGQNWEIVLRGTSVAPKLFVTPLTVFGVVEIGDTKRDTITVENLSLVPVRLDSLVVPSGYSIGALPRALPTFLQPREQFRVPLLFAPTQDRSYNGSIRAVSTSPCPSSVTGQVQGRGQIVQLDVPTQVVNFGFTRPCECSERVVPLQNPSFANAMTVRAIVIDSTDIPGGTPQLFSWSSLRSPNGTTPYQIPANTADTLRLRYCPRIPAEDRFTTSQARLLIQAQGVNWNNNAEVFLAGRRTLVFKPLPAQIAFTPTLINNDNATPQTVRLEIPGVLQNPSPQTVVIDSVSFSPNENVFRVLSPPFPIRLEPGQTAQIRVGFRPTAARLYEARMTMFQAQPCRDLDTTVFVSGIGFDGNAAGMPMAFSNRFNQALDTFRVSTCGTFSAPIFAFTRLSAAAPRIITARVRFDTTLVQVQSIMTQLATQASVRSTRGGVEIRIATPRLDSLQPLVLLQFTSISPRRAALQLDIDSIRVVNENGSPSMLFPSNGFARVIIQQTSIAANPIAPTGIGLVRFDSVQVLDCRRQTLTIRNTGDLAVRAFSLVNIPPEVRIVSSVPALTDSVRVGQSLQLTLEYCPRSERLIDTTLGVRSELPCASTTAASITGRGILTDFPVQFTLTTASVQALRGRIADTLTVPLLLNRNFSTTFNGTTYWLRNFRFAVNLRYSPSSLKFIDAKIAVGKGTMMASNVTAQGALNLNFAGMDSLRAGAVALLRFVVPAPDTLVSLIRVNADSASFRTDSLLFLRIRPQPTLTTFTTDGICNISYLPNLKGGNVLAENRVELRQNAPNPASDKTSIEFELAETGVVRLSIYSAQGMKVQSLLDGRQVLQAGRYQVEVATHDLAAGMYFYVLESGGFTGTKAMVIVR